MTRNAGASVKVQVWDTAGAAEFSDITRYTVTSWLEKILQFSTNNHPCKVVLWRSSRRSSYVRCYTQGDFSKRERLASHYSLLTIFQVTGWLDDARQNNSDNKNMVVVLLGNKSDLEHKRAVSCVTCTMLVKYHNFR